MNTSAPSCLHMLYRFQEDDGGLLPGIRWRVYSGALDGQTRHYRLMYDEGSGIEAIEHAFRHPSEKWIAETHDFLESVAVFMTGRHLLFVNAVETLMHDDPWLSYAAWMQPQIEPVD